MASVGPLKVAYHNPIPSIFKYYDNVVAPVRILQDLGVDVFKDMRFDSWAIQTLILRIENNMSDTKARGVMCSSISPMFCMFNHDCNPSAEWPASHQGGLLSVTAKRDIKKGEEITVSYILDLPLEKDRRPRLMAQLGTMCNCVRCYKDRDTAMKEGPADMRRFLRWINEVSVSNGDPDIETEKRMRFSLLAERYFPM